MLDGSNARPHPGLLPPPLLGSYGGTSQEKVSVSARFWFGGWLPGKSSRGSVSEKAEKFAAFSPACAGKLRPDERDAATRSDCHRSKQKMVFRRTVPTHQKTGEFRFWTSSHLLFPIRV